MVHKGKIVDDQQIPFFCTGLIFFRLRDENLKHASADRFYFSIILKVDKINKTVKLKL